MKTDNAQWAPEKIFWLFIAAHLLVWTIVPTLTNHNLPIDVIEGLAWGNEGQWGYHKHPPLSPLLMDLFASLSNSSDWAQYILSPISVVVAFWGMWRLANEITTPYKALISVLLLEGVYYHGYSSPEFNANIILLPFWSLAVYFFYKAQKTSGVIWWALLAVVAALGMLGKYFMAFLLISMFAYLLFTREGRRHFATFGPYLSLAVLAVLLVPHILWMLESGFTTISYGVNRASGGNEIAIVDRIKYPLKFLLAQLPILLPLLIMLAMFGFKRDKAVEQSAQDRTFIGFVTFGPVLVVLLISAIMGWKLRSMWGVPLFLTSGLCLVCLLKPRLDKQYISRFKTAFLVFALLGPIAYIAVYGIRPLTKEGGKRTQFPGTELAEQISATWYEKFPGQGNPVIVGDVWRAGNISYYWPDRAEDALEVKDKRAPTVYINGDTSVAPWAKSEDVDINGAIVVWKAPKKSGALDPRFLKYKEQFPNLEEMPPLSLEWNSWFNDKPMQVHWGIIAPK